MKRALLPLAALLLAVPAAAQSRSVEVAAGPH